MLLEGGGTLSRRRDVTGPFAAQAGLCISAAQTPSPFEFHFALLN